MEWLSLTGLTIAGILAPLPTAFALAERALADFDANRPDPPALRLNPSWRRALAGLATLIVVLLAKDLLAAPFQALAAAPTDPDLSAAFPWSGGMSPDDWQRLGGYLLDATVMAAVVFGIVRAATRPPGAGRNRNPVRRIEANLAGWILTWASIWCHTKTTGDPLFVSAATVGFAVLAVWLLTFQSVRQLSEIRRMVGDTIKKHGTGLRRDQVRAIGMPFAPARPRRIGPWIAWLLLGLAAAGVAQIGLLIDVRAQGGHGVTLTVGLMAVGALADIVSGGFSRRQDRAFQRVSAGRPGLCARTRFRPRDGSGLRTRSSLIG